MRIMFSEYGGFIVEVVAGIATVTTMGVLWAYIRHFVQEIAFMLI